MGINIIAQHVPVKYLKHFELIFVMPEFKSSGIILDIIVSMRKGGLCTRPVSQESNGNTEYKILTKNTRMVKSRA